MQKYEGLRLQLEKMANKPRAGWKVGLTSGKNRNGMGLGFRPFGYILQDRVFASGVELNLTEVGAIGVENELCFRFANDVPENPGIEGVVHAIESVSPAFELNERRLTESATEQDRLADNLSQWGIVVGEPQRDWQSFDFEALEVALYRDNELVDEVNAVGHIDDHLLSLQALSRTLQRYDRRICAGDYVITGAFTRQQVSGRSSWRGEFSEGIGSVEVNWR